MGRKQRAYDGAAGSGSEENRPHGAGLLPQQRTELAGLQRPRASDGARRAPASSGADQVPVHILQQSRRVLHGARGQGAASVPRGRGKLRGRPHDPLRVSLPRFAARLRHSLSLASEHWQKKLVPLLRERDRSSSSTTTNSRKSSGVFCWPTSATKFYPVLTPQAIDPGIPFPPFPISA